MTDHQPPTVDRGVVVPREPTEAMIRAGMSQIDWCREDQVQDVNQPFLKRNQDGTSFTAGTSCGEDMQDAYRAMLSAAPAQPPAALDEAVGLLRLADAALANVTAFEDDARCIMGNTNYEITAHARDQVRAFFANLEPSQ